MNKKAIYALAILIILACGGYFLAQKLGKEIEILTKDTLAKNNIESSEVKYNILSQTLTIKDVKFIYTHNAMKMDNKADEIQIKGISKDNFLVSAKEEALVCDEISFKNLSSKYYAYDNEELETTTANISISSPVLNISELLSLHKTAPFSEEYFQCLLDIKHDGINLENIKMQVFKGSESEAVINAKKLTFPPFNGKKFDMTYQGINASSSSLRFDLGEMLLEGFTLPRAKDLAMFSKTAVRLNELERSGMLEDDPRSFIEYETLSNVLAEQLSGIVKTSFNTIKFSDFNFYFLEIPELANTPISFKELSHKLNENETELKITSSIQDLTIAKEYLSNMISPAVKPLITEKFANGLKLNLTNSGTFNKENGKFISNSAFNITDLAEIKGSAEGTIVNKDKNAFLFNIQSINSDMTKKDLNNLLKNITVKNVQLSYDDKSLIDFAYQIISVETGMNKENIQKASITHLKEIKQLTEGEGANNLDKEIAKVADTLMQTLNSTGKFFAKLDFNPESSLYDLCFMPTNIKYTFEVKAK